MKVAISQRQTTINEITYDCLEQGWYNLLCNHTVVPIPNLTPLEFDADMLILSGGNASTSRNKVEIAYYNWAITHNIPVLGVCHGAFLLNQIHQGTNVTEVIGHQNTTHTVSMEKQIYHVNSYHRTSIKHLGVCLDAVAWHTDGIEAFRHKFFRVWGVVWHPERMVNPVLPAELWELINDK